MEYLPGLQQNFTTSASCAFVVSTCLTSRLTCNEWRNFPCDCLHFSFNSAKGYLHAWLSVLIFSISLVWSLLVMMQKKYSLQCRLVPCTICHKWMKVLVAFWPCQLCVVWCWWQTFSAFLCGSTFTSSSIPVLEYWRIKTGHTSPTWSCNVIFLLLKAFVELYTQYVWVNLYWPGLRSLGSLMRETSPSFSISMNSVLLSCWPKEPLSSTLKSSWWL